MVVCGKCKAVDLFFDLCGISSFLSNFISSWKFHDTDSTDNFKEQSNQIPQLGFQNLATGIQPIPFLMGTTIKMTS